MTNKYSNKNIEKIKNSPYPRVLLNVCTHGTERVGLKVAKHFKNFKPLRGVFIINIANEKAVARKKRFINQDLNRVFPGKKNGGHEERLAYRLAPFIRAFDIVVDVHSTETGMASSLIITTFKSSMKPLIQTINPKRIIYMKATKSNALISEARVGIGFEYGKDKSLKTYKDTVLGTKRILAYHKMIPSMGKMSTRRVEFYEVTNSIPKPEGFIVKKGVKNFSMIKKGAVIGYNPNTKEKITAKESFYPFLFGKNRYKTIFGFSAQKTKNLDL
ncbi:MAG: succinylglutamate desuccinylase/aspartoacylase family protein [Patescibacteria group bacterium]